MVIRTFAAVLLLTLEGFLGDNILGFHLHNEEKERRRQKRQEILENKKEEKY